MIPVGRLVQRMGQFISNCSSDNYSRLLLGKNFSYVPVPSYNPFIGYLNYTLLHLPKILSQRSLSERLGHSPAGISSLIGFQWNVDWKLFPSEWMKHTPFILKCRFDVCGRTVTTKYSQNQMMSTPWCDCMDKMWGGKSSSLIQMQRVYVNNHCLSGRFDLAEHFFETIL